MLRVDLHLRGTRAGADMVRLDGYAFCGAGVDAQHYLCRSSCRTDESLLGISSENSSTRYRVRLVSASSRRAASVDPSSFAF